MAEKKLITYLSIVFSLLCFTGMIFQSAYILKLYFEYKTNLEMRIGIPAKVKIHSMSFCVPLYILADVPDNTFDRFHLYEQLTHSQLLDKTPAAEDFIIGANFRKAILDYQFYNKSMIPTIFNISKFSIAESVCYRIQPLHELTFDVKEISTTPYGFLNIFTVKVNRSWPFEKIRAFMAILHSPEKYPRDAFGAGAATTRVPAISKSTETVAPNPPATINNWSRLDPQTITTSLLEPPYETNCFNYSKMQFESQTECIHTCILNRSLLALSRVPYSVVVTHPYDLRFFSSVDYRNATKRKIYENIARICKHDICSRPACESVLTMTRTQLHIGRNFSLTHSSIISSWTFIKHRPFLSLVEAITYVMGIIGTYTGLTVLSLDPMRLFVSAAKRRHGIRSFAQIVILSIRRPGVFHSNVTNRSLRSLFRRSHNAR